MLFYSLIFQEIYAEENCFLQLNEKNYINTLTCQWQDNKCTKIEILEDEPTFDAVDDDDDDNRPRCEFINNRNDCLSNRDCDYINGTCYF